MDLILFLDHTIVNGKVDWREVHTTTESLSVKNMCQFGRLSRNSSLRNKQEQMRFRWLLLFLDIMVLEGQVTNQYKKPNTRIRTGRNTEVNWVWTMPVNIVGSSRASDKIADCDKHGGTDQTLSSGMTSRLKTANECLKKKFSPAEPGSTSTALHVDFCWNVAEVRPKSWYRKAQFSDDSTQQELLSPALV